MNNNKIDVALISFAHGHQVDYGGTLADHPKTQLKYVADYPHAPESSLKTGSEFAKQHSVPFYPDYRDALANEAVEAVSLAMPPEHNAKIAADFAKQNVHIMCEKPVAVNIDKLQELGKIIADANVKFTFAVPAVIFSSSFAPALEQIRQGAIGRPRVAHFQFLQPNGPLYTLSPERCKEVNEGELANFGPYGALVFAKIFNQKLKSVYANASSAFYPHYQQNNIEDIAALSLEYEGGAIATMVVGRTTTNNMPSTDARLQVVGSKGTLNIENGLGYGIEMYCKDAHRRIIYGQSAAHLYVDDFVESILTDRSPQITFSDAVQVAKFMEMAYSSIKSGCQLRVV